MTKIWPQFGCLTTWK